MSDHYEDPFEEEPVGRWLAMACAEDGCPNPATSYVAVGDRRARLCDEHLAAHPTAVPVCVL